MKYLTFPWAVEKNDNTIVGFATREQARKAAEVYRQFGHTATIRRDVTITLGAAR